jgi:beta-lactam-binding protein with PASTA domain
MKKFLKRFSIGATIFIVLIVGLFIALNDYIMPAYVDSPEAKVPDLIGKPKEEAFKILESMQLQPVLQGTRYDENFPKDHVMFQNPRAGRNVKIHRRVYLYISGGEPLIKLPNLVGKTLRDAKITLERLGLAVHKVKKVRSEFPPDIVVDQQFPEGTNLAKGDSIDIKISLGPQIGMIRVPNLLGKTLRQGRRLLRRNSLRIGKINYQKSPNLLPNTIIDQYPSENKLVNVGDSVDVFVTKN